MFLRIGLSDCCPNNCQPQKEAWSNNYNSNWRPICRIHCEHCQKYQWDSEKQTSQTLDKRFVWRSFEKCVVYISARLNKVWPDDVSLSFPDALDISLQLFPVEFGNCLFASLKSAYVGPAISSLLTWLLTSQAKHRQIIAKQSYRVLLPPAKVLPMRPVGHNDHNYGVRMLCDSLS